MSSAGIERVLAAVDGGTELATSASTFRVSHPTIKHQPVV
jgi:hypothetical protein